MARSWSAMIWTSSDQRADLLGAPYSSIPSISLSQPLGRAAAIARMCPGPVRQQAPTAALHGVSGQTSKVVSQTAIPAVATFINGASRQGRSCLFCDQQLIDQHTHRLETRRELTLVDSARIRYFARAN